MRVRSLPARRRRSRLTGAPRAARSKNWRIYDQMFSAVGTALQFPIPIYRNASNISRNIFGLRGVVVMSGDRRQQTKMELSIFPQRRSIRFRSRQRERYSVLD